VHSPLEFWFRDFKRTFDAWEEGGVGGIAIGYLRFAQPDGSTILLSGMARVSVYGWLLRLRPPRHRQEKQLPPCWTCGRREWEILLFGTPRSGLPGGQEDPFGAIGYAAGCRTR
jgi:hypothetical protein